MPFKSLFGFAFAIWITFSVVAITAIPYAVAESIGLAPRILRDCAWLTRRRIRDYSIVLIAAAIAMFMWILSGHNGNDPAGRTIGGDFIGFWTAAWAALHGQSAGVYSLHRLWVLERALFHREDNGTYAFLYPPTLLLIIAPLAFLPYLVAFTGWLVVGLASYLSALWRILPDRLTLLAGLGFPALLLVLDHGQTTAIVVALLIWALIMLPRDPALAGVLIGVMAFKPQLGLLVPIALLAGGYRRTVLTAAATLTGMVALSILVFGPHVWRDFFAISGFDREILNQGGGLSPYYRMQSVFSALRLLGAPLAVAYTVQVIVSAVAAWCVFWTWRKPVEQGLKNALLCAAIPLSVPYLMDYDLLVLAPAIAWLASAMLRNGSRPWERFVLISAFVLPIYAQTLGALAHLVLAPLVVGALVAVILVRIRASVLVEPVQFEHGAEFRGDHGRVLRAHD